MLFAFFVVFFVSLFISFIENEKQTYDVIYFVLMIYLIILAGFRLPISDYENYLATYLNDGIALVSKYKDEEFTIPIIVKLSKLINNSHYTFFVIYAILGVSIKMVAIRKLSPLLFLSIIIYLSNFYIHQEMVQIRCGVASGIFLLSIKPLYNRNFLQYFLLCLIAASFHYSAVIYFVIYYIVRGDDFNKKYWILMLFLALVISIAQINLVSIVYKIPLRFIQKSLHFYLVLERWNNFNVIGIRQLLELTLVFIFVKFSDKISLHNKYFIILLKLFITGIMLRLIFSTNLVIANRISDLVLVTEIVLFPMLIYVFNKKTAGKVFVVCIGLLYLINRYTYMTERVL